MLVPKKRRYYIESVYTHYAHTFEGAQLEAARRVIAEAYPDYLADFDRLMKGYLSGRFDAHEVEAAYYSQMRNTPIHI